MPSTFPEVAACKTGGTFTVIHPLYLNALMTIMADVVEASIDLVCHVRTKYMACVWHVYDMCMTYG